uniref:Carrier domain-containing protein n=1 Tax=Rhabditophanes sp. KR3021 TaxID=114890 RepID=A0AC35U619_9BILA
MDAFKNNLLILLEYFKHHYFNDSLYIHITDIQIQTSKQTELHHSLCIKGVNGFFIYANIQNTHRLTINSKVHSSICSNLHQISFDFKSNYTYNYNELLNIFVSNLPLQVLDNFHDYRFSIKLPYLHSFENSLLFLGAENNLRILQSHNFEIAHLTSKQNDCNAIENYLVNYLNKILINEIEEADMNTSFIQLGMDSLQTSLFEYEIQKRFEYLIIPNLLLLKYNTLTKLSHFLQQSCEKVEDKTHIVKKEKEIFYIKPTTNQIRYLFIKNINNSYFNSLIEGAQLKIGQTPDIINLQNKVLNLMASNMILRTIYTNQNKLEVLSLTESFIHLSLNDHIEDKNVNLFFFCHHCACDGLSFQVIYNYLIDQFVFNKDSVQYSTFSTFEDNYFDSSNYIKDKEYWGSKLFSFSYCLYSNLKLNLLKPKNSNFDVLQRLSTQTGCSFYSICLFAYRIAILKIHAIDNISIGIPCSGRIHNKFESVIGSFINPIPFIFNLHSSNTIRQEIQSHHKMLVSDLRHQALPFDQIKECSKLSGQLYDVMFIQETNILKHNISNVKKMLPLALECPQVWSIDTHVQHCEIHVSYSCDISKIEIENIIKEFDSVMKFSIKEMSSNYPLVAKDYPNAFPLFDILQKQADLSNTIVYNEDKSVNISLNNLLTKANFLSMTLNNEYFETFGEIAIRDIPIGIQSTRNINMLSMVLAIWKSGFAVLPINANSKLEQIKVLINSLIISEEKIAHIADEKYIYLRKNSRNLLNYTNIFYLTETSGTTGNSKLVCSEGEGLLNLVTNYTKLFYLTNTSKIYQVVNYAFDIFFADILKAFVNGSDIVLADDQIPKIQTFDSLNISHSYIMPAYISRLNKTQLGHLQSLKYLHYGGESLSAACLDFLYKLNIIVCQEYGSTEHAIYTNILQMRKNMNPLRIGNPIDNVGIENGVYQSNLSAGILFSYGIGLFRGYLYQDTQNMNGLFTKDMVYHLNNKEIILKGRLDNQIKLDGIKVDLNEIQEILLKHSNISELVNHTILFKYLESKIFVNVIPKYYFYHEQFKLNSNGKIDRKYLHDLVSSQTIKNYGCKPVNDSYSNIVKTFAKFIHCPELEISDNLFEKGGTSISLMMAVHEVAEQFNYYINLTDIFEFKSLDKIINKAHQNYMWFDNEVSQHSDQYSIKWKIEFNRDVDSGLRSILHITSKNIFQRLLSLTECYINFSTSNSVKEGIDLTNELPISIYHVSNRSFGIDFHHIAVDGHSLQLIRKNLFVMYKLLSTNLSITERPKIKLNSCFAKFAFDNHQMTTRSREALQQSFFKSIKTNKYIQNICFNTNQFPKEDEFSTFITILVHVLNDLKTDERFQIFTPMSLRTPHFQNIVGNFVDTFLLDITSSNQISKDIQINKQHIANVMQNKNMQLASNMNASRIMFILDTFDNNDNFMLDNEVFVRIEEEVSLYSVYNQIWTIQKQENGIKLIINYSEEKYSSNTIIGYVNSYFKILDQMNSISMLNGITSLWEDVLEVDSDFDRHKSFFELGGNSISAAILCSNIRQKYRLDCYVSILFDNPLIDNFVNHLLSFGKNSKPQNIASNVMYQGNKISNHAYSIKNHFALPILKYLEKNINNQKLTNTYCNSIKVRIENVSLKAMNVKINNVLKIQPMLRSIFEYKNGTYHTLILSLTECFINLQNVSKYTAINYNYENLFEAPWFFAYLCNDFFILEVGHTCVDGFSIICLEKYLTNTPNLYSVNQLNQIKSSFNEINNIKIDTAYKNYLKECNEQTIKQNYLFNFDPELKIVSKKITILNFKTAAEQYLKQYQCSEFVLIYGIICESLMKSLNVSKLCILSTFDSRQIIYDLDKAVGMFVNVLPVLIQSPDQDHIREAISYMANRCHLDIEEYFNSNAQIMITQMNPVKGMKNKIDKKSKFDLTIFVETSDELNIVIQGSEKLFNTDWMQNLLVLIQEILTEKFQQTKQRDYPGNLTLLSILCKQAELTPYNFAIKTKLSCLTYSNLIEAITILCFNLQRQYFIQFGETIVPESIISFLASKSTDHILTILAILKCGAAYNPIDDKYPTERIDKILENCSTMLFFNNKNIIQIHKQTYFYFFRHLQSNLSYIINTSGTTGIPKAVCIGQEGLINMITESTRNFKLSSTDTVYQFTNLVYDNSVLEIFSTLCNGSSLYQSQQPFDSLVFVDEIREFQITHAMLFPGIIKTFNDDELLKMNILKYWIVGAEKLPQALLNKMIMNKVATIQNYGPTETTGYCIWRFMRSNDNAQCLGKPIANMKYRIIENELELSGIGLMWGYINNNTREWYKTGDLVSTINQNILFNCRKDKQIKIYGHRVELIEIEGIIELLDEIKECKAVFSESINIVYVGSTKLEHDYIIQHCKKYLPLYCLPKRSLKLEKIPLTSNNKVNEEEILNLINEGLENTIIQIWGKLPFEYDLDMNDNFYSLGGDSLLLLKLISILRQKHAIFLDINELLYCQTISDIMSLTQNSSSDKIRYRILIFPALYGNMIPYQQFINEINKITKHIDTLTEFTNYLRICYQSKYTTFPGITLMIGASFGGLVAYEFSKNLIDTHVFNIDGILNSSNNKSPTFEEHGDYIIKHLNKLIPSESNTFKSIIKQSWDLLQLSINYVPYYDTQKCMTLLVSNKSNEEAWSNYCVVSKYQLEGDHTQILSYPNIKLIMEVIKKKFFI